jgi:hypothetical protein
MKTTSLLKLASFFFFFTFLGHTIGIFLPIPEEQISLLQVTESMKLTHIPFPIGKPKSYYSVFLGNNLITSLALFLIGAQLLLLSFKTEYNSFDKNLLILLAFSACFISIISHLFFFPLPAICTALGNILILITYFRLKKS